MATMIKVSPGVQQANEIISAIRMLRNGFGKLEELNGLRAEAIGQADSAATMQSVFGVEDATQAQALSDRWATVLTKYGDGTYSDIRDLVDTFVS